jgi:alpha-beta hydrolase superfamily lysophospholipase
MIVLLALAGVILGAAAMRLALPSVRRWRMAAELRGDWWSRFERQMRAYERDWRLTARERQP